MVSTQNDQIEPGTRVRTDPVTPVLDLMCLTGRSGTQTRTQTRLFLGDRGLNTLTPARKESLWTPTQVFSTLTHVLSVFVVSRDVGPGSGTDSLGVLDGRTSSDPLDGHEVEQDRGRRTPRDPHRISSGTQRTGA